MLLKELCFLVVTVALVPRPSYSATKDDYYSLYTYLFNTSFYNKDVRPAEDSNSTLEVYVVFTLLSINDVDEKQQTLVTSARLSMYWDDYYLSWISSAFGGIQSILAPQKSVFLPDVVVGNAATSQTRLGYDELRIRLYADGILEWQPTLIMSTSCDIDITYFPFDSQLCKIVLETAVATKDEIEILVNTGNPIDMSEFSENGLWEVTGTFAENMERSTTLKSRIGFDIRLRRRRTYYVMNIILPIFFLSLTSSLVFALPGDEGEKMGTGITVLLSYTVYLSILSDLVPNTSLQVSILGLYLIILLALSTISLVVCVFILRLHAKDESEPAGRKLTKVCRFFERFFCWRKKDQGESNRVTPVVSDDVELKGKSTMSLAASSHPEEPLTLKEAAYILDLFCFMLFTFLTVLITVVSLIAVGVGGALNAP